MKISHLWGFAVSLQSLSMLRNGGLLFRMTLLTSGGAGMLYVRWRIMGTGPPAFTEVDNPASFADSMLVRVSSEPATPWTVFFPHQIPRSLTPPPRLTPLHANRLPNTRATSMFVCDH